MTKRSRWALSSLTGVVAWFVHLLTIYTLGEFTCVAEGTWPDFLGLNSAQWSIALATALLSGLSAFAGLVGWREWKKAKSLPDVDGNRGVEFLMGAGLMINFFLALIILGEALPIFFLGEGC